MSDYLFDSFAREQRPLRGLMEERAWTARANVGNLRGDDFTAASDAELVDRLIADWCQFAQRLVRHQNPESSSEPVLCDRRTSTDTTVTTMYWRWIVRFPLSGNLKLLETWPAALDMEPCGSDLYDEPAPEMVWQIGPRGPIVMLDVPRTEDEAGEIAPSERATAATKLLIHVIKLINDELGQFDQQLRQDLAEAVKERRERLGRIKQRTTEMIELIAKECPPLLVDTIEETKQTDGDTAPSDSSVTLHLVNPSTFEDLVRVCHRWIESAQRFPSTFAQLKEDHITSIIVSVLNVTFDTAQREVFIGEGKCDIYVEAERGDRTCKAYVGEAKIWNGRSKVEEHLKQVLGYAPSHIRQAMLLYYVRVKNIDSVRKEAASAIQRYSDIFHRWVEEGATAVLRHPKFDHEVELAVVYAHFPRETQE